MATPDMDIIKDIPGYKVILKAVLKSQIQQLVSEFLLQALCLGLSSNANKANFTLPVRIYCKYDVVSDFKEHKTDCRYDQSYTSLKNRIPSLFDK